MNFLYPFFIAFGLVFVSELGDKTQLLVLSFSSKVKSFSILLGVAIGSLLSHGIAITFGSALGSFDNVVFQNVLKLITYISFLFFGIITLFGKETSDDLSKKGGILKRISNLSMSYIFVIAFTIAIGELGDKTFLASLGLGTQYPSSKLYLVLGAVFGMVVSDAIAILFGKFLSNNVSSNTMNILSGIIFLFFGIFGFINFFMGII